MADLKRLEAAFIKADRANDTRAASVLAAEIKRLRGAQAPAPVDNKRSTRVAAPDPAVENDRKKTAASIAAAQKSIASLTQQLQNPIIQSNPDRYRAIQAAINGQKEALSVNQDRLVYLEKTGKLPPGLTATGGISEFFRGIPRALTQFPGQVVEGVAGLIGTGLQVAGAEETGKAISNLGTRAERANTRFAEDVFGGRSEATKYSPTAKFIAMGGEGVGSTLPYVITSGLGGTAANLSKTGRATRLTGGVPTAEKVAQRTNYLIAGAQGSQQAGQQAQEFREQGGTVSPLQELAVRGVGTGLGLTEVGAATRMIERLPVSARTSAIDSASNLVERATLGRVAPKPAFDAVKRAVAGIEAKALGRTALSTVEESAQEAGVQLGQNLAAKAIYNPNQDAFEGVGESALLGGIVGGTISGGVETTRKVLGSTPDQVGAPPPPRTPPTAPPPAEMEDLAQALGPVGGTITLQDAFGPQDYTFQGFDKKGSVILTDIDGVTLSEDPNWVRNAIKTGVTEPEEGLGGMAFSTGIEEEAAAPPPPPPTEKPKFTIEPAPPPPPPTATEKPKFTIEMPPVAEEPELPPPPPERVRTVTTPGGSKVNTAFEVVDASNLTAATGDLQNRDRSRASTDIQVQDIFSNFDPERLGESLESDRGSPIVGPDNTVESGNGRVMAINKVYDESPEKADAYRNFIEGQGFDTSGFERPVLVRRRIDRMTPEQRSKFVRESNMDTKLQLSTSEKAQTDAASLTPDVMGLMASPDVSASANQGFVRAFLSKLPTQEQAAFLDKEGRLSADGIRRLRTAVKSSAYGDADLINTLDESQDNNIKSIGGALEDVAPAWRRMLDAIRDGEVAPEMDTTKQLVEAAKIVRDVRNKGMKIGDFLSQQDAFNPLDPVTERFIRSFYNESLGRAAGREAIADALNKYARRAAEQTTSEGLFGRESMSPTAILDGALDERGTGAAQPDMYASIQPISPRRREEILDEGGRVPSLSRGVTKLKKLWADGKIDAKQFAFEVASYSNFIEDMKNWKRWEDLGRLKVRGPDRIRSVLLEQKRKGNISEEEANFAEWFIMRNENLLGDLGIAVRKPSEKGRSSGFYDVLSRVMYLIKGRTNDDTTVHEIMHHLERMMPQDIRMAIKRAWAKELDRVERLPYEGKNENDAMFFKAIRAFHNQEKVNINGEDLSPSEAFKFATDLISDGEVDGRLYQYVNPSEFWAVNATEIMRGRYEVKGSLLGRLKNWLRELSAKIKGLFGLDSNAPIIKALDSLAKGDGKFVSDQMLEEKPGDFRNIAPTEEQDVDALEGEPTATITPAKLSRVRQSANRIRTSKIWSNIASQFSGARAVDNWLARSYGLESLPETDSFYSAFETYLSKKNGKLTQLRRKYVDPIDDAVGDAIKNGVTMDEINDAIQARGAAERNAGIAEINKDMPDGGSGMTNAEADAKLRELQASGKMRYINRVVRLHDRLRDETQKTMVKDGIVSAETMAAWKKKYPNYTPYKGWAPSGDMTVDGQEDPHADYGSYEKGAPVYSRVSGLGARPVKAAKGRSSQAANSLYNMIADAEMFLEMGQKNQIYLELDSSYQSDPAAFEGLLKIYDENNPKIVKGKAVKITDEKAYENGFRGFKNGKPFIIETAPNEEGEAVSRAFTNLDPMQLNKWVDRFLRGMAIMRGLHTRFNPAFWPREFLRSVSDAAGNVYTEKGRKRSAAYGKSAAMKTWMYSWDPSTMAGVFSYLINKEPGNEHIAHIKALTEEMVVNGGAAGQEFAERAERVAKRMEEELKRLTATGVKAGYFETKAGFAKLIKAVDGINDFVDIVPRVAAYRALTEAKVLPKDAAQIALRSTLDMTKRGRFGRVIDGFFWWTTPSLTNLTKKVTGLDSSTYRKLVLAQLSAGFALGMMNIMNAPDSDDDGEDDYSQLPEWRKLAFLHVYYSPNEKPFTAPIGFLFVFERYVGGKIAEVLAGKISDGKAVVDIMTASQDVGAAFLASLSPVIRSTEARTLAPTSIAPMYDLLINESFFKSPIYNEPFDESEAQASRVKRTTPEVYKIIAEGLQEKTGGYGRIPGDIDVSPDQLKYFVDQYAGGVGRLVSGAAEGDIETLKKLNPFYFDPKLVEYSPMSRFYERRPEMKRAIAADKLAEDGDSSEKDFLENTNPVVVDSNVMTAYKDAEKDLKDLRKDANEMDPKEYRTEQIRIMSEFNRAYNDAKKGNYSYTPSADDEEDTFIAEEEEGGE